MRKEDWWVEWANGVAPDPPYSDVWKLCQSLNSKGWNIDEGHVKKQLEERGFDICRGSKWQKCWWVVCKRCKKWRKCIY